VLERNIPQKIRQEAAAGRTEKKTEFVFEMRRRGDAEAPLRRERRGPYAEGPALGAGNAEFRNSRNELKDQSRQAALSVGEAPAPAHLHVPERARCEYR